MPRQSPLVVYVLGAGFSRPLGFPLVSDFLRRAADLFHGKRTEHQFLGGVLSDIARLAGVKLCFASDLTNIEEVLSLIAMEDHLGEKGSTGAVQRFVATVISDAGRRPTFSRADPRSWDDVIGEEPWGGYVAWVARILNVIVRDVRGSTVSTSADCTPESTRFGVISLNYDMVLETCSDRLRSTSRGHPIDTFSTEFDAAGTWGNGVPLVKLHGSAHDPASIVPMTWSKNINAKALCAWRAAYNLLEEATEIRFIGYSLPPGDSYIRFLLKAALVENQRIRQIDALALDPDGRVGRRFRSFIKFPAFRFIEGHTTGYLSVYRSNVGADSGGVGGGIDAESKRHEIALLAAATHASGIRSTAVPVQRRRARR